MYEPPYDSPLEDQFAWKLSKYLRPGTTLEKQVPVRTICGTFRIDLVATTSSACRIAYECDGAEFHDAGRDQWRDAMILGAEAVDAIVRLRGSDLTYHQDDVLLLLAKWDPELFSERSFAVLARLASEPAKNHRHDSATSAMITYWAESESRTNPLHVFLVRSNRRVPSGLHEFWQTAFGFAKSLGGGDLDAIIAQWRQEQAFRVA